MDNKLHIATERMFGMYLKGRPLDAGPDCSEEQMAKYRLMSEQLNRAGDGDSGCFILRAV